MRKKILNNDLGQMTSLFSLLLRGNMEKYLSIFIGKFLKPKCLETN
jgi:hypothetical protein